MLEKRNYFELTSQFKFLLHTWSLSVEVQYYFIAPLLCGILHRTYEKYFILSIIHCSLFLQWTFRGTTFEFDLLFCRLWQFLIGTLVFLLAKENEIDLMSKTFTSKRFKLLFFGGIVFLTSLSTMPELSTSVDYKFVVRLLATISAGAIVYSGHYEQPPIPEILDSFLTYLGDISYSFYLVHWPVILFGRYSNTDSDTYGFTSIVVICIVSSMLLYELLDRLIPTKSTFFIFTLTGFMLGVILMICLDPFSLRFNLLRQKLNVSEDLGASLSIEEIIKMNEQFEATCNKVPVDKCYNDSILRKIIPKFHFYSGNSHSCAIDVHKNGTKSVALLGNSFAARFAGTALEGLKAFPSIKKIYLISRVSCPMLDTLNNIWTPDAHCEEVTGKTKALLKKVRPDITIFVIRYNLASNLNVPVDEPDALQNDSIILNLKKEFSEYEKYTNKMIFIEPSPVHINSTFTKAGDVARILTFNRSSVSLDSLAPSRETVEKDLIPSWTRIKAAISDCEKCTAIPTLDLFCEKTKCPVTEPSGISRYCDKTHLSEIGANLMLPRFKNVLNEIL
ncbi:hypothetical protein FO519_007717 [Halicephalobus sp. NKZ332]|nr:hypothetical protein FO519_007717 [Halicephalobus sp. NKZ332]